MKKRETFAKAVNPIEAGFTLHDILQVIVGAFVLAVPVGFTEEVWNLGATLPKINVVSIIALTLFFIGIFTYYSYHRQHMHANLKYHVVEFTKRVITTYVISFVIVAILMASIGITPLIPSATSAFNIIVLVTFPAAIGAVISDRIR